MQSHVDTGSRVSRKGVGGGGDDKEIIRYLHIGAGYDPTEKK